MSELGKTMKVMLEILREKYRGEENAISVGEMARLLMKRCPEKYENCDFVALKGMVGSIGAKLVRRGLIKRKVEVNTTWFWVED